MNEDLDYQKILNLQVYARSRDNSPLPNQKKQVYLNKIISQKASSNTQINPRTRIQSQVSFEQEYPKRLSKARPVDSIERRNEDVRDEVVKETKDNEDFTESEMRRHLLGKEGIQHGVSLG
jgi:hypothetical protein